jgi:hypothetical protein
MAYNGWCYEQVCLAGMFKFSTNVIGKLAYTLLYEVPTYLAEFSIGNKNRKTKKRDGKSKNNPEKSYRN